MSRHGLSCFPAAPPPANRNSLGTARSKDRVLRVLCGSLLWAGQAFQWDLSSPNEPKRIEIDGTRNHLHGRISWLHVTSRRRHIAPVACKIKSFESQYWWFSFPAASPPANRKTLSTACTKKEILQIMPCSCLPWARWDARSLKGRPRPWQDKT